MMRIYLYPKPKCYRVYLNLAALDTKRNQFVIPLTHTFDGNLVTAKLIQSCQLNTIKYNTTQNTSYRYRSSVGNLASTLHHLTTLFVFQIPIILEILYFILTLKG